MSMTLRFVILQINYFALFCTAFVFVNPVLSFRGFDINRIGVVITLSAIISIIIQPTIGRIISDIKFVTNKRVMLFFMLLIFASNILAYTTTNETLISMFYIIIVTSMLTTQTFLYTFTFDYINSGIKLNFGLARGLGSLAFAITSLIVGHVAKTHGYFFIKYLNIVLSLIVILSILSFDSKLIKNVKSNDDYTMSLSFKKFFKKYRLFTFLLVGFCLLITTHVGTGTFLNDIAISVSQTSFFVGASYFVAALLELPIMGVFDKLNEKFGDYTLVLVSAISFTVKAFVALVGLVLKMPSIIFISQFFQLTAFALYLPASLYYLNKIISPKDRVKAQSYLGVATTVGNVLASFIGSKLIYNFNTTYMLFAFFLISLIGTIIVITSLEREKL